MSSDTSSQGKTAQNKDLFVQLKAVLLDEKQKKHKHLEFNRENQKEVLLVIDHQRLTSYDLYSVLVTELQSTLSNYQIDFASFVTVSSEKLSVQTVASVLTAAINMGCTKVAFPLKTTPQSVKKHKLLFYDGQEKTVVDEMQQLADAQTFTRELQDMPSNYLNPQKFVEIIEKKFAPLAQKVKVTILTADELLKKKMGLICGVAQGSVVGPRMIVLEYQSDPKAPKLALIGKGVCFDTGGYNVKTSFMNNMKIDMSGAAAVGGTIYALAKNNVKTNVVGVMGMVENLLSLTSYRPDDVLTSYQGTTVEIDNTDAEGRLVIADCLTYAYKDLKADLLVSIATLTGAITICLGSTYAGCWTSTDQEWAKISRAASIAGEGVWRLPFHDHYLKPLKSPIADWKNSSANRNAPSSRAAMFLKEFTNHLPYIHLDIAALASTDCGLGTGTMVRTLYHLAKDNH